MNKIFKKIWNRHRGCFVAVSEAMTAACQKAGKAAVVLSFGLASIPVVDAADLTVNESQTINGGTYGVISTNTSSRTIDKGTYELKTTLYGSQNNSVDSPSLNESSKKNGYHLSRKQNPSLVLKM